MLSPSLMPLLAAPAATTDPVAPSRCPVWRFGTTRTGRLGWLMAVTVFLIACSGTAEPGRSADPLRPHRHLDPAASPNILLIVLDTARGDRMSHNGYPRLTTPYIDAVARDGVIYRQAHSVSPWTLPSHVSMFTGMLPSQHGATWRAFGNPEDMSLDQVMARTIAPADPSVLLPEQLRQLGYSTTGFSSNAWVSRRTGFERGFDTFVELWRDQRRLEREYGWLPSVVRTARETDEGDAGLAWLRFRQHALAEGEPREPFFLFFNLIDPHYPYSPPAPWRYSFSDRYDLGERIARFDFSEMAMVAGELPSEVAGFGAFYDAEVSYVDFVVGQVATWLHDRGYYDETLVIVTSDHGEHLGERGRFSHQFSVSEELLHIPLVIKYPGGAQAGHIVENPLVSNLDVFQTVLDVATGSRGGGAPNTASRNLEAMGRFDRDFLIAEYSFSRPYLRAHHDLVPDFSIEANAVTQRVVYDGTSRHVFVERDGATVVDSSAANSQARARAAEFLEIYRSTLDHGELVGTDAPMDDETLQRLRSLGYVR